MDSKTLPKLPRMYGMRVEKNKNVFGKTANTGVLSFSSGSKTKTLTGKGVLNKARREARELSLFSARKAILATPTHKLQEKATKVHAVPQTYINDHKRAAAAPKDLSKPAPQLAKASVAVPAQLAGQKRSIAYLEDSDDDDDLDNDPLFSESAHGDRERQPVTMRRPTTKPAAAPRPAPPQSLLSHFSSPLSKPSKVSTSHNPRPALISPPPEPRNLKASKAAIRRVPVEPSKGTQEVKKPAPGALIRKLPSPPTSQFSPPTSQPSSDPTLSPPKVFPSIKPQARVRKPVDVFMPQKRRKIAPR